MISLRLLKVFLVLAIASRLFAQELAQPTVEMFSRELRKSSSLAERHILVRRAFEAQRLDLIGVCFEETEARSSFIEAFEELPDQKLREDVVVLILRGSAKAWADPKSPLVDWGYPRRAANIRMCLPTLNRYLADRSWKEDANTFEQFQSREKRAALADELQHARNVKAVNSGGSTMESAK